MKKIGIRCLSLILIVIIIFTFVQMYWFKNEVYALSSTYTQYIKSGISSFPESYQKKLAYLKYLHPNWEFKAYYTGISWDELVSTSAENACMKNTIYKGSLLDPAGLCRCGQEGDAGYYDASNLMVRYYLDPRNFLGEAMVFQFLDLANGEGITRDIVLSATRGTYLEQYTDYIMSAASEAGINPLHIVATIFQELGRGEKGIPRAISGTVAGYEGYYNFYNYGATDGEGAVERGLAKAKELGWNTPQKALTEGAKKVLASYYISAGQTTKYFYKFDVVGNEILTEAMGNKTYNSNCFYSNQYMTNVRDPASQAGDLYDIYDDNGILDEKLTFLIPVYNNMPEAVNTKPTTLTTSDGSLYYINSLKKYGIEFRTGAGTGYSSMGNLYKDTVVALQGSSGSWTKVKIYAATSFNSSTARWNYETKTGWVSTEYLAKVGTDVPDYRNQVDMGASSGGTTTADFGQANFKIDESNLLITVTPATKINTIIEKYPNCVMRKADGTVISDSSADVPTGATITINSKTYTAIKYGDSNGDGILNSGDLLKIQKHLLSVAPITDEIVFKASNVNKDETINSGDLLKIQKYLLKVSDIEL